MVKRSVRLILFLIFLFFLFSPRTPAWVLPTTGKIEVFYLYTAVYAWVRLLALTSGGAFLFLRRRDYLADVRHQWHSLAAGDKALGAVPPKSDIRYTDVFAVSVFYMATRLVRLMVLPGFCDEMTYARYGQWIARGIWTINVPHDGKKPLYFWIGSLVQSLGFRDPLMGMRVTTVLFGLVCLIALMAYAGRKADRLTSLMAGLLFVVTPYSYFYSRVALIDLPAAAFLCLLIVASDRMLSPDSPRSTILAAGMAWGMGILTKTYAATFFAFPVAVAFQNAAAARRRPREWEIKRLLFSFLIGGFLVLAVIEAFHIPISESSKYGYYADYHGSALAALKAMESNFAWIARTLIQFMGLPVLFLAVGHIIYSLVRPAKGFLSGFLFLLCGLALFSLAAAVRFPRYIFFSLPILVLHAAFALHRIREMVKGKALWLKTSAGALGLLVLLPGAYESYRLALDPVHARAIEKTQFVYGFPSGYEVSNLIEFLRGEARSEPLTVFLDGYTEIIYANMYLEHEPRITIWFAANLQNKSLRRIISEEKGSHDIFLRFNSRLDIPVPTGRTYLVVGFSEERDVLALNPGSQIIKRFTRPGGLTGNSVLSVQPNSLISESD